jgi:hypothetical protein
MAKRKTESIVPVERIQRCILFIRGEKVILDKDLAILYGVGTKRLNEQVQRNSDRFPPDFMFQLTTEEFNLLRSQFATSKERGGRQYRPYAFTEQGVAMLSSVLRSQRAVEVNIAIMRTFVQLRKILADNSLLRHKIESLERKYDEHFQQVFAVLEQMLIDDPEDKKQIGYHTEADK